MQGFKISSKTIIDKMGVCANSETVYGLAHDVSNPHCLIMPKVKKIKEGAFQDLKSLEAIYIPETVKRIGPNAFKGCTSINTIIVHDAIETIMFRNEKGDMDVILHKPFSMLYKNLIDGFEARLFKAGEDLTWV